MIERSSNARFSTFMLVLITLVVPSCYVPILEVGGGGWVLRSFDLVILALPFLFLTAPTGWWEPGRSLTMFSWMGAFAALVALSTGALFLVHRLDPAEAGRILRAVFRLYETFVLAAVAINCLRHMTVCRGVDVILLACAVLPASSIYIDLTTGSDLTRIGGYAVSGNAETGIEGRYSAQANFNELGALCGTLSVAAGGLLRGAKSWRRRVFYLVAVLLFTAGTVLTASRSGLIAEAVGLSFVALFLRGQLVLRLLLMGAPILLIAVNPHFVDIIFDRIGGTFLEGSHPYQSASDRLDSMSSAWRVFEENPVLGVGYAAFRLFSVEGFITPECYYLEILADLGICGAVAFCGMTLHPIRMGLRHGGAARETYLTAGLAPVITILVSNVSGNNLFDPSLMMVFLIFLAFAYAQQWSEMPQQRVGIRCDAPRHPSGVNTESPVSTRT